MRIGINLLYLRPSKVGGSETYVRELIKHLAGVANVQILIFCNKEVADTFEEKEEGVQKYVNCFEPVPYKESLRIQQMSDLCLFLNWNDPKEKGVYSGKLFEYLGSGTPILSIGQSDDVAADLIMKHGVGVVLNNIEELTRFLHQCISDKQITGDIPKNDINNTEIFTRKYQTKRLEEVFSTVV